jgi:signal peptidase I
MKRWLKQNSGLLILLLCFGIFRTAVADWNTIPSGSMRPTLLEGDVVLVNRLAYDLKLPLTDFAIAKLGDPQRGEVVIFSSPADGVRLIKRLIALPGDVVEMREEELFVNGTPAEYGNFNEVLVTLEKGGTTPALRATEKVAGREHAVQFLPRVPAQRSFGPTTVPQDSYFFLGDNRDNSNDSRYIGPVQRKLLVGRAHHVAVSLAGSWMPRWGRTGERIQ